MRTKIYVISAADAAFLLRVRLGTLRAWEDFLADNRRGKQDISGYTILPCAKKKDCRTFRPMYAVEDVLAFIENVRKVEPTAVPEPIKPIALEVDDAAGWKAPANKFDERGCAIPAATSTSSPGFSSFHGYVGTLH